MYLSVYYNYNVQMQGGEIGLLWQSGYSVSQFCISVDSWIATYQLEHYNSLNVTWQETALLH